VRITPGAAPVEVAVPEAVAAMAGTINATAALPVEVLEPEAVAAKVVPVTTAISTVM
jgi:hypothetical protein